MMVLQSAVMMMKMVMAIAIKMVVLKSVVMMMINQFLPRQNHLLSLSQMSGCSVFRFRSLNAVIGAYTASSTFLMAMLIMTMIDDGGRDVYDVCDLLSTKDVGSLKHSAFNVVFSLTLFICKWLHWWCSMSIAHLQMLICKWKWWHWRYSTRGNYLHRFWMKLTFLAKWISAFLAPRTVVDELLESESFSNKFVKLCSHETFSWKMEQALQINYFPTLKHPRHWGSLKPWV